MPPAPRKNEDFTVSDDDSPTYTFNAVGEASLTPSLTAKQAREKLPEPKLHLTIHVILRTACLMIASIYMLHWIGLFDSHFWLAVFLCSCAIEESSPALNNMLQVRMILLARPLHTISSFSY